MAEKAHRALLSCCGSCSTQGILSVQGLASPTYTNAEELRTCYVMFVCLTTVGTNISHMIIMIWVIFFFFTYAAAFDQNEMSQQATLFLYACLFTFNDNVLFNVIPIYGRCDKLHLMGINEQLVIRQGGQALLYRKGLMLFE